MDSTTSPRDENGRFATGNRGGPGRPRGRGDELRRAAEEAVSPEHITAMIRKFMRMALEGNLAAGRLVLERTCGRAAEAPTVGEPLGIELPHLLTAADCAAAIDRLAEAVSAGTIDLSAAKVMLDLVLSRMKAIELNDLETRLTELEKAAATVELPGSRNGRRL